MRFTRFLHKQVVKFKYSHSWSHKYLDPMSRILNY